MIKTFSMTDIGKKRKMNQDTVYTSEQGIGNLPNLFIVADGMGGHKAGDYASKVTVETFVSEIGNSQDEDPQKLLFEAALKANQVIHKRSLEHADYNGMGTTVVAASCIGTTLNVLNVGDSRLYILNNKEIRQITRDHSLVEEMVRRGGLAREAARNHPDKNIITRAIGVMDTVEPDFYRVELAQGDLVLMCTDGLTNMLEDEEIRMIINGARDLVEKTERLVEEANKNGGKDNITVLLIEPFA